MAALSLPQVSPTVIDELYAAGTTCPLSPGQTLYEKGRESHTVYVVLEGVVKLILFSRSGGLALVALRGIGDLVGQHGALDGRSRSSGAEALVACELLCIPTRRFQGLLREHVDLAASIMYGLSRQVREATQHIAEMNEEQASVLIARRLIQLAVSPKLAPLRNDDGDPIVVHSPMSQRDLASWAGVSERSTGAALQELRNEQLISTGRLRIDILDLNGLRAKAGVLRPT